MKKHKTLGQVFTPKWIVDEILDSIGYTGTGILDKYILEPSSGDGIFLLAIVERYINEALKSTQSSEQIIANLEKYIYGIELDTIEYDKSIVNLTKLVQSKLDTIATIKWNIFNINTLYTYKDYISFFDFVVGNPPYIRIHNLDIETRNYLKKEFAFSQGTIDIYLSFFEMGFKMLSKDGVLGFITPNSFLHNSSYKRFREYLKNTKAIKTLIDFKSNKVFNGFSTYTSISIVQFNDSRRYFDYKEYVNNKIENIAIVNYETVKSNDWSFSNGEDSKFINDLHLTTESTIQDYFDVQYGFATLRDHIYISEIKENDNNTVFFNNQLIEVGILKKIIKGSTFKGDLSAIKYIIFPYKLVNNRYVALQEIELEHRFPLAYQYFLHHKPELLLRDLDKGINWYEFGRSQGIQSIHNEKVVCSTLMKDTVLFYRLPADVMVYSGIFIIKKNPKAKWESLLSTLSSDNFRRYIKITGKDFSGGYKSITSKQIKQFKLENQNSYDLFNQPVLL